MPETEARRALLRGLLTEIITAFGRMDFETFSAHVHPDCEFDWPYKPLKEFPDRMAGRDMFIEVARADMTDCDGLNHKIDRIYDMADPDCLVAEYHTGTTLRSSGKPYGNKYLGIVRFEGDQLVYWREYVNPLPIIEALASTFATPH